MRKKQKYKGVTFGLDRHGTLRARYRGVRNGRRIDRYIHGEIGSDQFISELQAARSGEGASKNRARHGTFDFIIQTFKQSPSYASLASSSQKTKNYYLNVLSERVGDGFYAETKPAHVEMLMAQCKGATAANRLRQVIAELFDHATKRHDFQRPNPARLADLNKIRSTGHRAWNDFEQAKFRAAYPSGTTARLSFELMLGTAAGRADAISMTRNNVNWANRRIRYARKKTGIVADVPITPELARELEQLPPDQFMLLTTRHGTAFPVGSFARTFGNWCRQAGLKGCTPHGLRKARAVLLAESGATPDELMSYLGHSRPEEAAAYTRDANRVALATNAARRAENKPGSNVVQPFVQPKGVGS